MNLALERLMIDNSLLIVVDVQGKLARLMHQSDELIRQIGILIDGCRLLDVPIIWAEQLPEKLGPTVPELAEKLNGLRSITKSSFGCCEDETLATEIRECRRWQVLLCGIETHVCVWQTACSLLRDGFQVHVIADAVSSRSPTNRETGIQRMLAGGAQASCVEMALFELMGHANHPKFREVAKLLK
ncbi:MAG: hydrolase [Pirellulales bacterium]